MMKLPVKVKAGENMTKMSNKVTNRLHRIKLEKSYHRMKIKSRLLRLIVMRFRFWRKSDMRIISSITYRMYKYLINQVSIKVKTTSSFCENGCP